MKIFPVAVLSLCLIGLAAPQVRAAVYEWVDDKGVVHFTDNADTIPAKYLKKVKERESMKGSAVVTPSTGSAEVQRDSGSSAAVPGKRLDEGAWRSRFNGLREEKKQLENGLVAKREKLNTLRRKKAIYGRGSDRTSFNEQFSDVARDEARIKELEQKLIDLDAEAGKEGVPLEWRK